MMTRRDPDDQGDPADGPEVEGGEAACYAHLVCPECGAVTTEGHRPGCELAAGVTGD